MKSTRADAGEDAVAVRLDALVDDMARAAQAIAAGRPEGIHRLRVAIRRVRSCLRTFRPLFERARSEAVRGELAWMSGVLAEARDPEVLARRLERRLDRLDVTERMGPVRPELVGERRAAAQRGRANVMAALQTDRYAHLIDELAAFARHPAYRPGRSGLDRRSLVRCARKEVRRAGRLADRAAGRPAGAAARRRLPRGPQGSQAGPLRGRSPGTAIAPCGSPPRVSIRTHSGPPGRTAGRRCRPAVPRGGGRPGRGPAGAQRLHLRTAGRRGEGGHAGCRRAVARGMAEGHPAKGPAIPGRVTAPAQTARPRVPKLAL